MYYLYHQNYKEKNLKILITNKYFDSYKYLIKALNQKGYYHYK